MLNIKKQMENKLTIIEAENGFICEYEKNWSDEDGEDDIRVFQHLIEDKDNDGKKLMTELLEYVASHFVILGETEENKYGEKNLRISWDKKGRKCD